MSSEDERTKENATVLAKVSTAAFPAVSLAPWMSHYDKRTEAVIVGTKTIADIVEEVSRQDWIIKNPSKKAPEAPQDGEDLFDTSQLRGADYMTAFCLNRLAINMHNYAPSIDGMRTRQAIALAKANNPGMATQPGEEKKRSMFEKLTFRGKEKDKQ